MKIKDHQWLGKFLYRNKNLGKKISEELHNQLQTLTMEESEKTETETEIGANFSSNFVIFYHIQHGFTALLLAVKDGNISMFEKLLKKGADINVLTRVCDRHLTLIYIYNIIYIYMYIYMLLFQYSYINLS
uniref:ANK_REP_REGION domain-containing protein n=1 Tax=Heterorhabditis bacteriophora TaxID=37862 RepID=A0A1I7WWQ6_HETBA